MFLMPHGPFLLIFFRLTVTVRLVLLVLFLCKYFVVDDEVSGQKVTEHFWVSRCHNLLFYIHFVLLSVNFIVMSLLFRFVSDGVKGSRFAKPMRTCDVRSSGSRDDSVSTRGSLLVRHDIT